MRLIDADELLETGYGARIIVSEHEHPYDAVRRQGNAFEKAVKAAPTVDAVPVVHGVWVWNEEDECWVCSICELSALNNYRGISVDSEYCPHCGADMRGTNNGKE